MRDPGKQLEPVLLVGEHALTRSIASCLQKAGCTFTVQNKVSERTELFGGQSYELAILITEEDLETKKSQLGELEKYLNKDAIIAINTETIELDLLQENTIYPGRIVGVNWTEPADTTLFLEIIANEITDTDAANELYRTAADCWNKDPYMINGNTGVRMRLMGALIREAFYLVTNGYATVEDIDRACRNDAGYYLPFAGNLRYMDLMGTYAYGMVMKDLNPELSTDAHIPEFFQQMLLQKEWGMESGKGFYDYPHRQNEKWQELLGTFSVQVKELIEKYPFNTNPEEVAEVRNGFNFR